MSYFYCKILPTQTVSNVFSFYKRAKVQNEIKNTLETV